MIISIEALIKPVKIRTILLLITGLLIITPHNSVIAQISKIEPPNWWAGMQNDVLELMVYGEGIADWNASISDPHVGIVNSQRFDSDNYLFVQLQLDQALEAKTITIDFTSENGETLQYPFTFLARRADSNMRSGFSAKDVIYLITPDRFANGDTSNDEVSTLAEGVKRNNPDGRHGGDLQGVTGHLEYLSKLGISQIWLNPVQENNQAEFSYHGYSISDLYNVDERFGGNAALKQLSEQAEQFGIGLIMDTIPNHIGLSHPWMKDLPSINWINNDARFLPTTHRRETQQDPHAAKIDQTEFNDGWFVETMPDLNQRNETLANYLIQNNIWWIEMANLSGLRVDTLPYGDKHFTSEFCRRILNEYPNFNIVGEEWSTNPAIVSYWQRGKPNVDGFKGSVPSLMDFPLQDALIKAMLNPTDEQSGMLALYQALANDFQYPAPSELVVIGDNHDMSRLLTQLNQDRELLHIALVFLMTTRGIPQIFYGTEMLMDNTGTDAHGVIRSDFPGGWLGDSQSALNATRLSEAQKETHQFITALLNWRKTASVIHHGKLTHFVPQGDEYVYFRSDDKQRIMVVLNPTEKAIELDMARYGNQLSGITKMHNVMSNESIPLSDALKINAKSASIYQLRSR